MNREILIGIDIGGTHIKGVRTNLQGDILKELSAPTEDKDGVDNSRVWKHTVKEMIEELAADNNSNKIPIGISSPGTINSQNSGVISNGTKLLGIEGLIWGEFLNRNIFVLNDAHAALFAESRLGAAKDYKDILMMTLGTGVGGGIMIDRKLLQGQLGRAGHIGHISIDKDPFMGIVNTPGSLENAVGECNIVNRSYGKYKTTKALLEDYKKGNTVAIWLWLNTVHSLARGIVSLINVIAPEIILIGGGISRAREDLMLPLLEFLDIYEWRPQGFQTPIKFAKLSNHAGAIGAALFAHEKERN